MNESFRLGSRSIPFSEEGGEGWKFETRPGGVVLAIHEATGQRKRIWLAEHRTDFSFSVGGRLFHGRVDQKKRGGGDEAGSDADLISQFPGKVRKVLVKEGQEVAAGDSLLLVEAMKMEFTIRAPYSGKITRVCVKEGEQLAPGTRFLEIKNGT